MQSQSCETAMSKTENRFAMSQNAIATLVRNANEIASTGIRGGNFRSDIGANWDVLYSSGVKLFVVTHAAFASGFDQPRWMDRESAIDWIATNAEDPVTGYGYAREQAERILYGEDAGRGYRSE